MLQIITAVALSVTAWFLYLYVALFWLYIWREKRSGTAFSLFLTNASWMAVIMVKIIQGLTITFESGVGSYPYSTIAAIFVFAAGVFQAALSRGYFNFVKEADEKLKENE